METNKGIETERLSEKELEDLIDNKKKIFTHNIFLMAIYLILIILSLFIV